MERFFEACQKKIRKMVEEKGRSENPWDCLSLEELLWRLATELEELGESLDGLDKGGDAEIMGELVDVANFCAFTWLKLNKEK